MPVPKEVTQEVIDRLNLPEGTLYSWIKEYAFGIINPTLWVSISKDRRFVTSGGEIELLVESNFNFSLDDFTWSNPENFDIASQEHIGFGEYRFRFVNNTQSPHETEIDLHAVVGSPTLGYAEDTVTVTIDLEPPTVVVTQPDSLDPVKVDSSIEVLGTYQGTLSPVRRIEIWAQVSGDQTRIGLAQANLEDGNFNTVVSFEQPLADVFLYLRAEDEAGNVTELQEFQELIVDGPPPRVDIVVDAEPNHNNWFNVDDVPIVWRIIPAFPSILVEYKLWESSDPEPAEWTMDDGSDKQITQQGRWRIKARGTSPVDPDSFFIAERSINLETEEPTWDPIDVEVISGFGAVKFNWNNEEIESFSGRNEILVRFAQVDDYALSAIHGVVSEEQVNWQYNDIQAGVSWFVFIDVRSQAGNVAENLFNSGPHIVLDLTPSNLNDELSVIFEGVEGSYFQTLYGLSNRLDAVHFMVSSSVDILGIEYLDVTTGDWTSVDNGMFELIAFSPPMTLQPNRVNVFTFDLVEALGLRVELSDPTEVDPDTWRIITKLAAESFIGATFEVQRGISFTNEDTDRRMAFDFIGLRGWKDINLPETFELTLDGEFFVGFKDWPDRDDTYIEFDPNEGDGVFRVVALIDALGGSIGGFIIEENELTAGDLHIIGGIDDAGITNTDQDFYLKQLGLNLQPIVESFTADPPPDPSAINFRSWDSGAGETPEDGVFYGRMFGASGPSLIPESGLTRNVVIEYVDNLRMRSIDRDDGSGDLAMELKYGRVHPQTLILPQSFD